MPHSNASSKHSHVGSNNHTQHHHPNSNNSCSQVPKNHISNGNYSSPSGGQVEAFEVFMNAEGLQDIMRAFHALCDSVNLVPSFEDPRCFYHQLRNHFRSHWRANHLFEKLDKRAEQRVYKLPNGAKRLRTFVVGAGPCGLRMAIEFAFLGCQTILVEKRAYFSRKNVLYLWQFVTDDLVNLGAKHFCGQFCSGSISHTSIRTLQYILLKVALLLGVQVFTGVDFDGLVEPYNDGSKECFGWRARIQPADHMLSSYEFDVLIGADGRRNNMPGFQRESTRCKMAIAVTANFERTYDLVENQVEELSGRSFHFNQEYFHKIQETTGVLLENIVYYRDETNYFIMTPHRESLLKKGVLKENFGRSEELLHPNNIDQLALEAMVTEVANFCTKYQLSDKLKFSKNHYGHHDVSIFDFTTVKKSRNACRVMRRKGYQLFMALVGDSLSEPFWPLGTGCAHGFLSVLDTAWAIRCLATGQVSLVDVIHERECLYTLLKGANLKDRRTKYTIEPSTRYKESYRNAVPITIARTLIDSDEPITSNSTSFPSNPLISPIVQTSNNTKGGKRRLHPPVSPNSAITPSPLTGQQLLFQCYNWFHTRLSRYSDIVQIRDLCQSWLDGKALLCLVHCFKPNLVHLDSMKDDSLGNLRQAITLLHEHFDVAPVLTAEELLLNPLDRISLVYYLQSLFNEMKHLEPARANHPEPKIQSRQDRIQAQTQSSSQQQKTIVSQQIGGSGFIRSIVGGSCLLRRSINKPQSITTTEPVSPTTSTTTQKGYLKRQRENFMQRLKENEDPLTGGGRNSGDIRTIVELAHLNEMSAIKKRVNQNKNAASPVSPVPNKKEKSVGRVSVPAVVRNLFTSGHKENATSPISSSQSKGIAQNPNSTHPDLCGDNEQALNDIPAIFSPGRQCRLCGQVGILLVERVVLRDGSVVHRDCLRCSQCNVSMEPHECHILITPNPRPAVNNQTTLFEVRCSLHYCSTVYGSVSPTLVRLLQRRRTSADKALSQNELDSLKFGINQKDAEDSVLLRRKATESTQGEMCVRSISCDRHSMQLEIPSSRSNYTETKFGLNGSHSLSSHSSLSPRHLNKSKRHLSNSVEVLLEEPCDNNVGSFTTTEKEVTSPFQEYILPNPQRPTMEWMENLLTQKNSWWNEEELHPENGLVWTSIRNLRTSGVLEPYFGSSERFSVDEAPMAVNANHSDYFGIPKLQCWLKALSQCQVLHHHKLNGHANGRSLAGRKEWACYRKKKKIRQENSKETRSTYSSDASKISQESLQSKQLVNEVKMENFGPNNIFNESNIALIEHKSKSPMVDHNKNNPSPPVIGIVGDGLVPEVAPCHEVVETHIIAESSVPETPISTPRDNLHLHAQIALSATLVDHYENGLRQSSLPPEEISNLNNGQDTNAFKSAALRRMQFMMQPAKPVSIDSKSFIADMNRNRIKISVLTDPCEILDDSCDFTQRYLYPIQCDLHYQFRDCVTEASRLCDASTNRMCQVSKDYDPSYLLRPKTFASDLHDSPLDMLVGMRDGLNIGLYQRSPSVCSIATMAAFNPFSFFGLDDLKDIDSISMVTELDLPEVVLNYSSSSTVSTVSNNSFTDTIRVLKPISTEAIKAPVYKNFEDDDILSYSHKSIASVVRSNTDSSPSSRSSTPSAILSAKKVDDPCATPKMSTPRIPPGPPLPMRKVIQSTTKTDSPQDVTKNSINFLGNDMKSVISSDDVSPLLAVSVPPTNKFLSLSWQKRVLDHLEDFSLSTEDEEVSVKEVSNTLLTSSSGQVNNNNIVTEHNTLSRSTVCLSDSASNIPIHLTSQNNKEESKKRDVKTIKSRKPTYGGSGGARIFGFFRRGVSKSHGNLADDAIEDVSGLQTKTKLSHKGSKKKKGKHKALEIPLLVSPPVDVSEEAVKRASSTDALGEALLWRPKCPSPCDIERIKKVSQEVSSPDVTKSSQRRRRCSANPYTTPGTAPATHRHRESSFHFTSEAFSQKNNNKVDHCGLSNSSSDNDKKTNSMSLEMRKLKKTLYKSFRTLQAQVKAQTDNEKRDSHLDLSNISQLSERERIKIAIHRQRQEQEATIMQRSQDVQCEKEEVEQSLQKLTETGKQLEKCLRSDEKLVNNDNLWPLNKNSEVNCKSAINEHSLLNQWFEVVAKQKHFEQQLSELHIQSKEIELEYRQSRLLEEYRLRQLLPNEEKSSEERRHRDREILEEYIGLVEERDTLIALLDQQHRRIMCEEESVSVATDCLRDSHLALATSTAFSHQPLSYTSHDYCSLSRVVPDHV